METRAHIQIIRGSNPREAFEAAQDDARHSWGHNGRTGTLAEAKEFEVVPGDRRQEWDGLLAARALLERGSISEDGPTMLIPLAEPRNRRAITARVQVNGLSGFEREVRIGEALGGACRPGEGVESIVAVKDWQEEGVSGKRTYRTYSEKLPPLGGDKAIKYHVLRDNERVATFDTPTEAKRWARELLRADRTAMSLSIKGEIIRKDGRPLFLMGRSIVSETVYVQARGALAKPIPTIRWAAAGLYPWAPAGSW